MSIILAYSGGKDSTALLFRLQELNQLPDRIVFADTGLEYPEMYSYIKKIEEIIKIKIEFLKGKRSWDDLFYTKFGKGMLKGQIRGFPFVITPCWALRDLKIRVLEKTYNKEDIILLGIAADEKRRIQRQKGSENLRYPLVEWGWTEEMCKEYLIKKKLLNPLYSKFKRLACWLCPKQSLGALKVLKRDYPLLWEKLLKYERDCPHGFKPRFKLSRI